MLRLILDIFAHFVGFKHHGFSFDFTFFICAHAVENTHFLCTFHAGCIPAEAREELTEAIGSKNASETLGILERYGVGEKEKKCLADIISIYGPVAEVLPKLDALCINESVEKAVDEFRGICALLIESGCAEKINIDFSIINDMKYYNGVVFKGYIEGIPVSILSGGQYDGMMRLTGRSSGAIGFAVYLDFLESLSAPGSEYDADTLIIYDDSTDLKELMKQTEKLREEGSVLVERRCRKV